MIIVADKASKRKKHPVLQDRVFQILALYIRKFKSLFQGLNTMNLTNRTPEINKILGIIPGAAVPLARSHRDKALREYQISPTISKWRKLTEACQRLHHVHALTNQQGSTI